MFRGSIVIALLLFSLIDDSPKKEPPKLPTPILPPIMDSEFRVSVVGAELDHVMVQEAGGGGKSTDKFLKVLVLIENLGNVKDAHYESWVRHEVAIGQATATPDSGQPLRKVDFGFGRRIQGQLDKEVIRPQRGIVELLVFEPPMPSAKTIHLELPRINITKPGLARGISINPDEPLEFDIPASAWSQPMQEKADDQKVKTKRVPPKKQQDIPEIRAIEVIRIIGSGNTVKALIRLAPSSRREIAVKGSKYGKWSIVGIDEVLLQVSVRSPDGSIHRLAPTAQDR